MNSLISLTVILNLILVNASNSHTDKNVPKKVVPNKEEKIQSINISELHDSKTLKFVFVVMRNADHYPNNFIINSNPSYEFRHYRFPRGELLKKGRLAMYEAGDKLKQIYPHLLGRSYVRKHLVKSYAVGSQYTLNARESALILKAGIRKKNKKQTLKRNWSTRKLATTRNDEFIDAAQDYYMRCPKYIEETNKVLKKELESIIKRNYSELWQSLQNKTKANLSYENLLNLYHLYELYETSELSHFGRPHWLTDELWYKFYYLIYEYVLASYSTDYLKSVTGGRMLHYFFDTMNKKLKHQLHPEGTRMMVHVGYEATVAPFLAALGGKENFTVHNTNYTINTMRFFGTGMVIIEAHQTPGQENDFWLRFFSTEGLVAPFYELKKNGCGHPCSYKQLKMLLKDIAINKKEFAEKCKNGDESEKTKGAKFKGE